MFKNLPIALKLGLGFGVVLLLSATVALVSLVVQGRLANGSTASKLNAQIVQHMLEGRVSILYYLWKQDDKHIKTFGERIDQLRDSADKAETLAATPQAVERLREIRTNAEDYKRMLGELQAQETDFQQKRRPGR